MPVSQLKSIAALAVLPWLGLACAQPPMPEDHDDDIAPRSELLADEILSTLRQQGEFAVSEPITSDVAFTRIGLMVNLKEDRPNDDVRIEARADDGAWIPATVVWREESSMVANVDLQAPATRAEVRIALADVEKLHGLTWELFVPSREQEESPAFEEEGIDVVDPAAEQALAGWLRDSGVKSRASWGARSSRGCSGNSSKSRIAIHHTVTGRTLNGTYERRLRQIQSFHMDSRGWCDVGYHFLVTADGRRWEARPISYLGAHVGGQNTGNVGISLVGCFHGSGCGGMGGTTPPNAILNGAARLVRSVARHYGIPINSTKVKGHRHWAPGSTSCPGDKLADKLGTIRSRAANNSFPN